MEPEKKKRNPLSVLFFTVFMDAMGFGILIPIIPLLFAAPSSEFYILSGATPVAMGYILLGLLLGIFPLMQFISTPILGQLSDRHGRRKLLAVSITGSAIGYFLFAVGIVTRNIPLLFIARALDGITGGNIAIAQAAIADVTEPQNRAKNFGMIGAAFGLGFIVGPFLGGVLSDPHLVSWFYAYTPFLFAAALSTINMVLIIKVLPETLVHRKTDTLDLTKAIHNVKSAFSLAHLRILFLSVFLFMAGFTFFTSFFSVFLIDRLAFNQSSIGTFFAYIGLWIVITQMIIIRRISGKINDYTLIKITMLGTGITIVANFLVTAWWQLLIITPPMAICIGLTMAYLTSVVSRSVDASSQGEILGINASVTALAQVIPPVVSGFIAASILPSTPVIVGAVVVLAGVAVFWLFHKPAHPEHVAHQAMQGGHA